MPKHSPGPGRRPASSYYAVSSYLRHTDSKYPKDWWGIPFRVFMAAFIAVLFAVVAGFGTHVAPVDPPQAAVQVAAVVQTGCVR